MDGRSTIELVLLDGGRAGDDPPDGTPSRGDLRVVRGRDDFQATLEESVAAARKVRQDIEARIARALDDLLRARAPEPDPR